MLRVVTGTLATRSRRSTVPAGLPRRLSSPTSLVRATKTCGRMRRKLPASFATCTTSSRTATFKLRTAQPSSQVADSRSRGCLLANRPPPRCRRPQFQDDHTGPGHTTARRSVALSVAGERAAIRYSAPQTIGKPTALADAGRRCQKPPARARARQAGAARETCPAKLCGSPLHTPTTEPTQNG